MHQVHEFRLRAGQSSQLLQFSPNLEFLRNFSCVCAIKVGYAGWCLRVHSEYQPVNRRLSRLPPCHAAYTTPSSATSSTTSSPLERRSVSIACCAVCAIGPATLKDVLTEISTPMRRPSAFR